MFNPRMCLASSSTSPIIHLSCGMDKILPRNTPKVAHKLATVFQKLHKFAAVSDSIDLANNILYYKTSKLVNGSVGFSVGSVVTVICMSC
jgi:hypothetical protein